MSPNLKHDNQTLKQNQVVILQLLTVVNFQLNGYMLKRLSSSQTSCSCREHIVQKSSLLKTDETSTRAHHCQKSTMVANRTLHPLFSRQLDVIDY